MKKTFTLLNLLFSLFIFSQNCDEIKKENDNLMQSLSILSKNNPVIIDDLKFQVVSISSNFSTKKSKVEILITNIGTDVKDIQFNFHNNDVIDINGNSYKIKTAKIGKTIDKNIQKYTSMVYKLNTEVPTKIIYDIEYIPNNINLIKAVQIGFLGKAPNYHHLVATCKNINVDFIK
jgi:hypothetical protein